ncbi:MAG: cupin domain-containing protein [Pseudomonadota bacterium]
MRMTREIRTIRPVVSMLGLQRLENFVGVSAATAGATGISMNLVVIPPGKAAEPHYHRGFETAIYMLRGRVETRYGPDLRQTAIHEAGDFIFIPANLPHQPVNLSVTEPAFAIVARNDPNEQESVRLYFSDLLVPEQPEDKEHV